MVHQRSKAYHFSKSMVKWDLFLGKIKKSDLFRNPKQPVSLVLNQVD